MDNYVTGEAIKRLREARRMTQAQLAGKLGVTDKAVSKWETCRGLPDVSLLEPLARALGISVPELLSGEQVINANRSANILRSALYVCPVCGNIIQGTGAAVVSCCGVALPPLEAEEPDEAHRLVREEIDGELFLTVPHEMSKAHYISFIAYVTTGRSDLVKLYPEGQPGARFYPRGSGWLYWYCNRHGLFRERLGPERIRRGSVPASPREGEGPTA